MKKKETERRFTHSGKLASSSSDDDDDDESPNLNFKNRLGEKTILKKTPNNNNNKETKSLGCQEDMNINEEMTDNNCLS